jgi:hypothetical protein
MRDHETADSAPDPTTRPAASSVMPRRTALKRLASGAAVGALLLTGCTPPGAPTPVTTSTPSPPWTPGASGSRENAPAQGASSEKPQTAIDR